MAAAGGYALQFERARTNPEAFWEDAAREICWSKPWQRVLDSSRRPGDRWFVGGELNTCYNAIDRHVAGGRGEQIAVIHDSPVTASQRRITFRELQEQVARFAGGLTALGVTRGDRVIIYMPMVPEALIAMHACARIGAIHCVVFGGFAPKEVAKRIDDATPAVAICASFGLEGTRVVEYKPLLDRAIELARHKPKHRVVFRRTGQECPLTPGVDLDWHELVQSPPVDCVPVLSTDPLYVLYTSGTTGKPKGVVRDNGGHAVALKWSMNAVYGMQPGEVFWAASDLGWVVGHSYIAYAPLLHGCTTVIYEGKPVGTPNPAAFWRVVEEHRVRVLLTAPTAIRAIRKEDPRGEMLRRCDTSSLRHLFLAGERLDPGTHDWASEQLHKPVIDHWWQTETGWPIAASCVGLESLPLRRGSVTKPVPGYCVEILDDTGSALPAGSEGNIALHLPLPPGALCALWNDDRGFESAYLDRSASRYLTGDSGHFDEQGYLYVMGRTDDIIIVAGHNISAGSIEAALASHRDVAECAAIAVSDPLKGELPLGLVVLKDGAPDDRPLLIAELFQRVRAEVGAIASLRDVVVVARLPKTRSGKILRRSIRQIANGQPATIPATIEDPSVLEAVARALTAAGYPPS